MKQGEIRYCMCGCGQPAKKVYSGDRFKSWRSYAPGHAPNERLEIRIPESVADLGYAAGIIDGEGCIYARVALTKQGMSTFLQLQVTMCSESVVKWLAESFGGTVFIDQPRSLKNRTRFSWQLRGRKIAIVLNALLPYLKEKRRRAEIAIELSGMIGDSKPGKNRRVPESEMARRKDLAAAIKAYNQAERSEDFVQ